MQPKRTIIKSFLALVIITFIAITGSHSVQAEASTPIDDLYITAVTSGKIDPDRYSKAAFEYTYHEGLKVYTEQLRAGMPFITFNEWFAGVRFGAMPDGSGTDPNIAAAKPASAAANIDRFVREIRKGDILIVESGGFGHAAIATTNNYILEMHGGGNIVNWAMTGISDNNKQYTTRAWIKAHIKQWTQIWRPRKGIGKEAATFADYKFWSSSHAFKKNRHITYRLTAGPTVPNPNYCSKMVWQSFWFGTGSKKVATGTSFFIAPSDLPNYFYAAYKPYKVGRY